MSGKEKREPKHLDPRIKALMIGRTPFERFMIAGLSLNMPTEVVDDVFSAGNLSSGGPVGMTDKVAGKPFHHWLGKTREQIRAEIEAAPPVPAEGEDEEKDIDDHLDDVETAFKDRDLRLPTAEDLREPTVGELADDREIRDQQSPLPTSSVPATTTTDAGTRAAASPATSTKGEEPVFGDDSIPLSELVDAKGDPLPDDVLMSKEGIGPATVEKIKHAAKAAKRK